MGSRQSDAIETPDPFRGLMLLGAEDGTLEPVGAIPLSTKLSTSAPKADLRAVPRRPATLVPLRVRLLTGTLRGHREPMLLDLARITPHEIPD